MAELPTGTVTFLFTDIEGSTRLLEELGDAYAEALAGHREVLRKAFADHGGAEVDTQGDAFFIAFTRARDAVAAAADAQRALAPGPIRVRMGIHTGEPLRTDEGYVGMDIHRGARIAAAGHGGQVLVSQAARELIQDDLPEEFAPARSRRAPAEGPRAGRNGSSSSSAEGLERRVPAARNAREPADQPPAAAHAVDRPDA